MAELLSDVANKFKALAEAHKAQAAPPGSYRAPYDGPCSLGEACPVCAGLGWFREDLPVYDSNFGKLQRCPNVSVWKIRGAEYYGLFPEDLESLTWSQVLPIYNDNAVRAAEVVRQVIERGSGWVYLYGDHGQAKSLILRIAVAEYLRVNRMAAYANMASILAHMRQAFDMQNPSYESEDRLKWWASLPLLALDEFERFNNTQWATESQFMLMDERNIQAIRGQSVTLIASNQAPDKLPSYYRSRIQDGRFITVPLYGPDARAVMNDGFKF